MDELREFTALDLKSVLNSLTAANSARPRLESTTPAGPRLFDPPGNFYASGIKQIQDDSASVFPESIHSNVTSRRRRWMSTYDKDYIPREEADYDRWLDEYMHSVADINLKPGTAPAFVGMRAMTSPSKMTEQMKGKDTVQLTEHDKVSCHTKFTCTHSFLYFRPTYSFSYRVRKNYYVTIATIH